jgi:hypothetical protein
MTDKWGRRLFTWGAIALVVLGLVHSLSLFQKPVPVNDTERQLAHLMSSYRFNILGSVRTMDNFLRGFSISFMLSAIGLGALGLVLRGERPALLKRIALVNTLWLAAMTAISVRYFFAIPTAFLAAALLLFELAWMMLSKSES